MVEDFLAVLVDGKPATQDVVFAPELEDALAAIDSAMDYGLLALQVHAAAFSIWPAMARAYERMAAVCEAWAAGAGPDEPGVTALRERLRVHIGHMQASTYLATEEWRAQRDRVYADMFAQCGAGLARPLLEEPLPAQLAACRPPFDPAFGQRLRASLAAALGTSDAGSLHLHELAACLEQYFQTEQAIVRVACKVQQRVNALLGRPAPRHPFPAAHMNIHNLLQAKDVRRLPYLGAELEEALGIRVRVDQEAIEMLGPDKERQA
jgi:hypothetical protein